MKQLINLLYLSLFLFLVSSCEKDSKLYPLHHFYPAILNVNPSHGPDSTQVTITGIGFSATAANDSVFFNGKLAKVLSASDTQLVAVVPTLAGSGNVIVETNGKAITGGKFAYDTTYRVSMVADSLSATFYLALDTTGNLFVSCYGDPYIHKISPQGIVSNWQPISFVTGIALDSMANLYFAANVGGTTRIGKVSPAGVITTIGFDTSSSIGQLALDRNGNTYLTTASNSGYGRIDKMTPDGQVSVVLDSLFNPSGLAIANDGSIYCTNYSVPAYSNTKGVVTKISPSGAVSTFAHINYGGYAGITLDAGNTLYVTNFDQMWALGSVVRVTPDGTTTKLTSGNLMFPTGIVQDKNGNFYVTQMNSSPGVAFGSVIKMTMH